MTMKFLIFLLLFTIPCFSENLSEFDVYQKQLSKDYVTEKISYFLKYSDEITNYYEVTEEAFILYASPEDKALGNAEYCLKFGEEAPEPKPFSFPLSQAKIAIDPGHIGGKFSRLEERYVEMEHEGNALYFDEGSLAFLTALHLKKKLEEQGATVFLTRKGIGEGAYSENFFDWLKEHPEFWEKGVSLSTIFRRHYNRLDLRARAQLINEFNPDITLFIHYNAIDSELSDSSRTKATNRNFNLVFIPGAFCQGELANSEDRYHFLRLICTQDLEKSSEVAQDLVHRFTSHLQVPPLNTSKKQACGFESSLISAEGVFCRNLALTRLVKGPLCYGETLIQNNLEEALELSKNNASVNGIPCSKRVIDVAEAYYEGTVSLFD